MRTILVSDLFSDGTRQDTHVLIGTLRGLGLRVDAASGTSGYGIQVGTGTNAVTVSDTKLQTQIAHGVGSGQLFYGAMSFVAPLTDATTSYFSMNRTFTNSSGSTITIQEIGLAMLQTYNFLIIRDIPSAPIALDNTDILSLKYTLVATA